MHLKASFVQNIDQLDSLCRYNIRHMGLNLSSSLPHCLSLDEAVTLVDSLDEDDAVQLTLILDNPSDDQLHDILSVLSPDFLEIVNCSDKERLNDIAYMTHLPLIQHIKVNHMDDIIAAQEWENIVDYIHLQLDDPHLLFDVLQIDFTELSKPYLLSADIEPTQAYQISRSCHSLFALDISFSLLKKDDSHHLSLLISELQRGQFSYS